MSVEKFREFIEKSGCSLVIGIFIALIFIFSSGVFSCGKGNAPQMANLNIVGSIGNYNLLEEMLAEQARKATSPQEKIKGYQTAINKHIDHGLALKIAEDEKIELTEEKLIKAVEQEIAKQIEWFTFMLKMQGKIKDTDNKEEVEKALKEASQMTSEEIIKRGVDNFKKEYQNPIAKNIAVATRAAQIVRDTYASKISVSDADLRKSYDTYLLNEISFRKDNGDKISAEEKAEEALEKIKKGDNFNTVKATYDKKYNPKNSGDEKNLKSYTYKQLNKSDSKLKSLLNLKPGETSGIINENGVPKIYQLVKIENKLPEDYSKEKTKYKRTYIDNLAYEKYNDRLKEEKNKLNVEWKSEAFNLLDAYTKLQEDKALRADSKLYLAKLEEIYKKSSDLAAELVGTDLAGAIRYVTINEVFSKLSLDEKKARAEDKIGAIQFLLDTSESAALRLELVELYILLKDKMAAVELLNAAERNDPPTDGGYEGQKNYIRIQKLIETLKKEELIDEKQITEIENNLNNWMEEKINHDKYQEEERRKREEEIQREQEERNKEKEATEKQKVEKDKSDSNSNTKKESQENKVTN